MSKGDSVIPAIKYGHMACPGLVLEIDRTVFKQTPKDRGAAYTAKASHKKELRDVYGTDWWRHLNVPWKKISEPIRLSF